MADARARIVDLDPEPFRSVSVSEQSASIAARRDCALCGWLDENSAKRPLQADEFQGMDPGDVRRRHRGNLSAPVQFQGLGISGRAIATQLGWRSSRCYRSDARSSERCRPKGRRVVGAEQRLSFSEARRYRSNLERVRISIAKGPNAF